MPSFSNLAQRVALTVVAAFAATATLALPAHAQRIDSVTLAPVRPPTVQVSLRGKAPSDSVRIVPAGIEIITIPRSALGARYSPWRGCGPINVTVSRRRWTLESLFRLQSHIPYPEPPQN